MGIRKTPSTTSRPAHQNPELSGNHDTGKLTHHGMSSGSTSPVATSIRHTSATSVPAAVTAYARTDPSGDGANQASAVGTPRFADSSFGSTSTRGSPAGA